MLKKWKLKISQWLEKQNTITLEDKINDIKSRNIDMYTNITMNVYINSIENDILIYSDVIRDITKKLKQHGVYIPKTITSETIMQISIAKWYSNNLAMLDISYLHTWLDLVLEFYIEYNKLDINTNGSLIKIRPYYHNVIEIVETLYRHL